MRGVKLLKVFEGKFLFRNFPLNNFFRIYIENKLPEAFVKLNTRVAYGISTWFELEIEKNKMILILIFLYLHSDAKRTEKLLNLPLDERFATRSAFLFWDRFFFAFI